MVKTVIFAVFTDIETPSLHLAISVGAYKQIRIIDYQKVGLQIAVHKQHLIVFQLYFDNLNPLGEVEEKKFVDDCYEKSLQIESRGSKQPPKFVSSFL